MESSISTTASTATVLTEKNGIIYFSVYSEGLSPQQWLKYFSGNNIILSARIKNILLSVRFKATVGERKFAIVDGDRFSDDERTLTNVKNFAHSKKFHRLNAENICLLRKALSDEDLERLGFRDIVVVRTGYKFGQKVYLGQISRREIDKNRGCGITTTDARPDKLFGQKKGFAFFEKSRKEMKNN